MSEHAYTNSLIHEASPYLLQHAHNPVNWQPWSASALAQAKEQDKMLLVSIGYSACHWCHVMEEESFMDPEIAKLMNEHFMCIKVDREERPDLDHAYMEAVQLLTGQGGWPLNCFALPSGKPVYGGTYFPKENWANTLQVLSGIYQHERHKIIEQANELEKGMDKLQLGIRSMAQGSLKKEELAQTLSKLVQEFDKYNGGFKGHPKFPMPGVYRFMLHLACQDNYPVLKEHVLFTLEKMAKSGLFDQVEGGFARYAVDTRWKVPHFEKMLYDNAQLLQLYAEAYKLSKNKTQLTVMKKTIAFMADHFRSPEGGFYSALDADSEGKEGKYYTWTRAELEEHLKNNPDKELFFKVFNITSEGNWEKGQNILHQVLDEGQLSKLLGLKPEECREKIEHILQELKTIRKKRIKPGLDDNMLAGWNGLAIIGLVEAYQATGTSGYLQMATECAEFIEQKLINQEGYLFRGYTKGKTKVHAFLDDYALVIKAFLALQPVTGRYSWFEKAFGLTEKVLAHFSANQGPFFYYNSNLSDSLHYRKTEIMDNVIPSSNAMMAENLYQIARYTGKQAYRDRALEMVNKAMAQFKKYPRFHYAWGKLALHTLYPYFDVTIVGPEAMEKYRHIAKEYLPFCQFATATRKIGQAPFAGKWENEKTRIFPCGHETCHEARENTGETLAWLKKKRFFNA
jgi:hypothetical protein